MKLRHLGQTLIVAAALATGAARASAELFIDAYVGPAFTQNGDFNHGPAASARTDFDTVVSGGARAGYYLDIFPYLGFALDVSHYQPDGKFHGGGEGFSYDARVTALSFDAMLRLPMLQSKLFPHGQLQPYLAVGPGVYFSHLKIHPSPSFGSTDSDVSAGFKAAAGVSWLFHPNVGLMAEYRFSYTKPTLLGFDANVRTHRLQFGPTFRF